MVKEITPKELRCGIAACPAVFEVTPEEVRCAIGPCPAVFDDGDHYFVIGSVPSYTIPDLVKSKIGNGEAVVIVPKKLLDLLGK